MRILFATKPHLPRRGGAETSDHWLATALAERGHDVLLLAFDLPARDGEVLPPLSESLGYDYVASSRPGAELAVRLESFQPDAVVVDSYDRARWEWLTREYLEASDLRRTVLHVHDVGLVGLIAETGLRPARVVTASKWMAVRLAEHGIEAGVVPPIVDAAHYAVESSRRTALLVNPIAQKGLGTVLDLADARPDVPFVLQRVWYIEPEVRQELERQVAGRANVELRPVSASPGEIYGDARVLLAPSVYPEAFGRVAAEAQASGIPALASASGALPEAVGDGGLLVDPEAGNEAWLAAFARVWDEPDTYARCAARARERASRPELSPGEVAARFEEELRAVAAQPV